MATRRIIPGWSSKQQYVKSLTGLKPVRLFVYLLTLTIVRLLGRGWFLLDQGSLWPIFPLAFPRSSTYFPVFPRLVGEVWLVTTLSMLALLHMNQFEHVLKMRSFQGSTKWIFFELFRALSIPFISCVNIIK